MDDEDELNISNLPEEILLYIFCFLKVQDIVRIGSTCRLLHTLTSQDVVWRQRFRSNNEHLLSLPFVQNNNRSHSNNNNLTVGIWKKLYQKASFALSFRNRTADEQGERLCAEFVTRREGNGIHFDDKAPKEMSVETWVKLDEHKPDGVIIGCQSESVR